MYTAYSKLNGNKRVLEAKDLVAKWNVEKKCQKNVKLLPDMLFSRPCSSSYSGGFLPPWEMVFTL